MKTSICIISMLLFAFSSWGNELTERPSLTFKKSFKVNEDGLATHLIVHATSENSRPYVFNIELPHPKEKTSVGNTIDEEDMNFDGHADIQIHLGYYGAGGGNLIYDAYTWNPTTNRFDRVENYMDITNPQIDSQKKCIQSQGRAIGTTTDMELYEWHEGKLTLIKQWKEDTQRSFIENVRLEFQTDTAKIEEHVRNGQMGNTQVFLQSMDYMEGEYDKLLNKYYRLLMAQLNDEGKAALKAAQVNWIKFQSADKKLLDTISKSIYENMGGGTLSNYLSAPLYPYIVKDRAIELYEYYYSIVDSKQQ